MYRGKAIIDKIETQVDELAPDTGAIIFSLKNLAPDKWSDKREYIDVKGYDSSVELVHDIISMAGEIDGKKTE